MINGISAADIAFIMSSSKSAWLLSPLECSPQNQNWTLRFCFWGWIMWKMYNKIIIEFGFRMISWIIKASCLCYLPQPSASADNTDLGFDNSWYHAQPHPIIAYYLSFEIIAGLFVGRNLDFSSVYDTTMTCVYSNHGTVGLYLRGLWKPIRWQNGNNRFQHFQIQPITCPVQNSETSTCSLWPILNF